MSDDLNTEIKIGADASGVEAGVGRAKRSLADLGASAQKAGKDAAAGVAGVGAGGDKAAKDVERATRSMKSSLQRLLAEQKAGAKGSREYWEALADTRGISRNAIKPILDQIDAAKSKTLQAKGAADSWTASLGKVGPLVAAAFSGAAITGFLGKVVSVQREFDVLNSSLKTVTGSSAAAEREMAWLKDFAKETPFGLAQATQGFVKMKALGLDPTRAALTSFGNTASAMGKDLNQMIEAVADASTGEFERLKEFGIKAKKEGDQVSLTFQGVTTTIGNSAREITQYLEDIGNTSFGGAMEERAKTLDGTIAALGDTWDELFRTVSTNNVGGLIFDSVTLANGVLEDATTILRAYGAASSDAARETGALSSLQEGVAIFFETVGVMAANVLYVLKQTGDTLGGLAAGYKAFFSFDFDAVRAIGEEMRANGEAARREIDATTARILNARKEVGLAASGALQGTGDFARMDRRTSAVSPQVTTPGTNAAGIRAANKALEDQAKLIAELSGLSGSFAADWDTLNKLYAKGKLSLDGLTEAQSKLLAKQPAIAANIKAEEEAWRASLKTAQQIADARNKEIDGIQAWIEAQEQAARQALQSVADRVASLRDEEQAVGLAVAQNISLAEAVEQVALARLQEKQAGFYEGSDGYEAIQKEIDARKELLGLVRGKAQREAATDAAKKAADEWQRTADDINQSLTEALMRGFESGKGFAENLRQTVVNMFKTMVLRPVVSAIVSPISGALLGGMGLATAAQAGQGGASSGVSTALSGASLLGSVGGSLAAGAGWLTGATTLGGSLSAGMSLLGTGSLAGAGAGLGMLAGALGPIALGIGLLSSAFSRKLKDQGIQGTLGGEAGFEGQQYRFYKGGLFRSDKTTYSAIDPELARMLAGGFSAVRDQVTDFAEALSLPTDRIKGFTTDIKVSFKGLDEAGIQKALQDALATGSNELAQQVLGTLTTTTREVTETLAGGMGDWGDGTMQTVTRTIEETTYAASEFARDGEQAIDTLTRLATSLYTVNDIWKNLGYTVYEASLAGADAASKMADAFGGLEAMAQATGTYFQNFYSAEEQRAAVERQLNEALGKLNLTLPDIDATDARAQYRALAEAQDRNTEAGREAYVVLLKLSGAFASVTAESETAAAAAARLADEQRKAAEDAARAAEEAARRAEQIARERYGLETQLMQLLGDTAGLRKREIEALDASNRALQEHIYAIEDARAAYEKSITAAQSAYSVLESSVGRDRSALQSALDAEREAITARYKLQQDGHAAQLSAAQSAADKMRGIASMLSGALGRMVVESPALDRARLQSARGVIGAAAASSNVMAPGLEAALSVVTGDVRKMYGRWEDFAFDRGVTAGQTAALSSAAQSQLSGYESIVNALKAQDDVAKLLADAELAAAQERFEVESKKLDAQLEQGKSMLDRLLGIEEGTLSSVEALARLTDAVNAGNAALQAQRAAEAAARAAVSAGAPGKASGIESALWAAQESAVVERLNDAGFLGSIGLDAGNLEAALADAAFWAANGSGQSQSTLLSDALGRIGGMDGYAVVSAAVEAIRGSGSLLYDNDAINFSGSGYHDAEKMRELERLLGVHGSHAGGLAYVPFDGYRAELHKGERVLTQDEARVYTPPAVVASMLRSGGASDGEILAELRSMRQRLEAIEAAANAAAGAAVGTDRKLARVVDNDALRTREKP